jgi:hypothetical protein
MDKKLLDKVAYKPICWFGYVDDTSVLRMEAEHILGPPQQHSFHHGDKEIATFPAGDLMA